MSQHHRAPYHRPRRCQQPHDEKYLQDIQIRLDDHEHGDQHAYPREQRRARDRDYQRRPCRPAKRQRPRPFPAGPPCPRRERRKLSNALHAQELSGQMFHAAVWADRSQPIAPPTLILALGPTSGTDHDHQTISMKKPSLPVWEARVCDCENTPSWARTQRAVAFFFPVAFMNAGKPSPFSNISANLKPLRDFQFLRW